MKKSLLVITVLSALPLLGAEPENIVVNGDFQTGTGNFFYETPGWYNRGAGAGQGYNARAKMGPSELGAYAATINDRYDAATGKLGTTAHFQKTAHVIREGDSFTLSYQWRPFDDFWQKSRDTVRFVLSATEDDTLGSPVVWSVTLNSDFFTGSIISMKDVTHTTGVVPAAAVGKKLMICFFGVDTEDGGTGKTHFARVDNIVIVSETANVQSKK
jgi:hypothetical protein